MTDVQRGAVAVLKMYAYGLMFLTLVLGVKAGIVRDWGWMVAHGVCLLVEVMMYMVASSAISREQKPVDDFEAMMKASGVDRK